MVCWCYIIIYYIIIHIILIIYYIIYYTLLFSSSSLICSPHPLLFPSPSSFPTFRSSSRFGGKYSRIPYNHSFPSSYLSHHSFPTISFILYLSGLTYVYLYLIICSSILSTIHPACFIGLRMGVWGLSWESCWMNCLSV